ncbi:acyltransferase domain-containing protein [Halolactibacillus miurensis]|nr:acyltransferase domain-containing protein [Halolactibacillus miurensis]SFS94732.1 hypothetical protein SAMN05421668_12011 [Halolactibacillus miurensis]
MTEYELYQLMELPNEVANLLLDYKERRDITIPLSIRNKILNPKTWDEGISDLEKLLVNDNDGIGVLWELLYIVRAYSYYEYINRFIPLDIFIATMKFCTRFLHEHYETFNTYKFIWAWWFPRQIALKEFRIGSLEYEFIEGEEKEIAIHIPSDANLNPNAIITSLREFIEFQQDYFPEWKNTPLTCNTWMLMPEIANLINKESNLVFFQNLFTVDDIRYDETWYMDWIYPGYKGNKESLPEDTSLQRNLKQHLLLGEKFGIAKGHISSIKDIL